MEKDDISHGRKRPRVCKDVPRRGDKQDLSPLPVQAGLHPYSRNLFNLVHKKVDHILVGMRLNPQVIPCPVTVGDRGANPVCVQTKKVEEFSPYDGDFGGVNAIGTKKGTAAALGALKEVGPPLSEHIIGEFSCPRKHAQDLACRGEFLSIDRPQKLRPEDRHVLGITSPDEKVAFVSAGTTSDTDIHEDL